MSKDIAIRVNDVKKSFKIYYDRSKTLKDLLAMPGKGNCKKREVLKGISFEVERGEAVALIGKNGCGKSTMLKMLTKIIYPDSGNIEVNGKVSSLLELGAGFHPDMSGRENIYLNASVFGLTKKQIDKKIDEIIKFSELEKFIDNPVRTYSSGMYMRLAFSVAINVQAEILLIDEILGVGDVSFQKKCFNKLKEIKNEGTTIVIVSHSMDQVERICDRSIWIYDGVIREQGTPEIIGQHYYRIMEEERLRKLEETHLEEKKEQINEKLLANNEPSLAESKKDLPRFCDKNAIRTGGEKVWFEDIKLKNKDGKDTIIFHSDDTMSMEMEIGSKIGEYMANIHVSICNENHLQFFGTNYFSEKNSLLSIKEKRGVSFTFDKLKLLSGKYYISVGIYTKERELLDEIKYVKEIYVQSEFDSKETGVFHMEHSWEMME